MKPKVTTIPYSAVKPLLFVASIVASIVLTVVITRIRFGKSAIEDLVCSLSCALPIFAVLSCLLRKRGILGVVLPLLPLVVVPLLCDYGVFHSPERSPQEMFKTYVVDPIPAGVTKIQARYVEEGLFEDVVITFQASPEDIATIIAQRQFERDEALDGYPDKDLPEYSWKGNWIGYQRSFYDSYGGLEGYIYMWVDLEQSVVILRYRM
jgi:hypothetical protein